MKTFCTSYKFTLTLPFYFFFSLAANSQRLFYNPEKDKYFLDSLKKITKKFESKEDNNYIQELKYFNTCIVLGEYYEKLFHKKIFNTNNLAVHYYEKVTDFGTFPGDPHYYKAAALRNNLCRKLAAIFFTGDGVKKDRKYSLSLALKGSLGYDGFFEYYSKKYFNCKCIFRGVYADTGTAASIVINPFARQASPFPYQLFGDRLKTLGNNFKKRYNKNSAVNMTLTAYPLANMISQALCTRLLDNIKIFMVKKMNLPEKSIFINCQIGAGDLDTVDIYIKKI